MRFTGTHDSIIRPTRVKVVDETIVSAFRERCKLSGGYDEDSTKITSFATIIDSLSAACFDYVQLPLWEEYEPRWEWFTELDTRTAQTLFNLMDCAVSDWRKQSGNRCNFTDLMKRTNEERKYQWYLTIDTEHEERAELEMHYEGIVVYMTLLIHEDNEFSELRLRAVKDMKDYIPNSTMWLFGMFFQNFLRFASAL